MIAHRIPNYFAKQCSSYFYIRDNEFQIHSDVFDKFSQKKTIKKDPFQNNNQKRKSFQIPDLETANRLYQFGPNLLSKFRFHDFKIDKLLFHQKVHFSK